MTESLYEALRQAAIALDEVHNYIRHEAPHAPTQKELRRVRAVVLNALAAVESAGSSPSVAATGQAPVKQTDGTGRYPQEPTSCPTCGNPVWDGIHRDGHVECFMHEVDR